MVCVNVVFYIVWIVFLGLVRVYRNVIVCWFIVVGVLWVIRCVVYVLEIVEDFIVVVRVLSILSIERGDWLSLSSLDLFCRCVKFVCCNGWDNVGEYKSEVYFVEKWIVVMSIGDRKDVDWCRNVFCIEFLNVFVLV